jgi:hypothetical protein
VHFAEVFDFPRKPFELGEVIALVIHGIRQQRRLALPLSLPAWLP